MTERVAQAPMQKRGRDQALENMKQSTEGLDLREASMRNNGKKLKPLNWNCTT
jgi:hypothetical protein